MQQKKKLKFNYVLTIFENYLNISALIFITPCILVKSLLLNAHETRSKYISDKTPFLNYSSKLYTVEPK